MIPLGIFFNGDIMVDKMSLPLLELISDKIHSRTMIDEGSEQEHDYLKNMRSDLEALVLK